METNILTKAKTIQTSITMTAPDDCSMNNPIIETIDVANKAKNVNPIRIRLVIYNFASGISCNQDLFIALYILRILRQPLNHHREAVALGIKLCVLVIDNRKRNTLMRFTTDRRISVHVLNADFNDYCATVL